MRMLGMNLAFDAAWPAWVVVPAAGGIVVLIWWAHRASERGRGRLPVVLRAGAALLLLLVLARPTLILSRTFQPRPALALALDTSASMGRADVPVPTDRAAAPMERLAAVVEGLCGDEGRILRQLALRYQVCLAAVSDRVVSRLVIDEPRQVPAAIAWLRGLKADGPRTDLGGAVRELLTAGGAGPGSPTRWAGLVLLSDGRRTAGSPPATMADLLPTMHCAAVAVPVGTEEEAADLRLVDVRAPTRVFVGEPVAIHGRLQTAGVSAAVSATLQLRQESADRPSAERTASTRPVDVIVSQQGVTVESPDADAEFTLLYRPDRPGLSQLRLKAQGPWSELNLRNNEAELHVEAVPAQIRVLYVEQESRFEYRYLKNLLVREPTVISSILLLSADGEFPQEGTEPIRQFPSSLEDLDRYDVILLGDVDPADGWIDAKGLENLARWVEWKGGGLGWMAGPRVDLKQWRGTPLGKVLPVRPSPSGSEGDDKPFRPVLTEEGRRASIFLLDAEDAARGIADLPEWFWCAGDCAAMPAAQVLATHPRLGSAEGPLPLVVTGHYGSGQTFYCGSDEMWRWRRFRDIEHWRAFWLQTVRWLGQPRKLGAYRRLVLEATPERALLGRPIRLDLRIQDQSLTGGTSASTGASEIPERVAVTIRRQGAGATAQPDLPAQSVWLRRPAGLAAYTASIAPDRAGAYVAEARLAAASQPVTATFRVQLPEAETADSSADPAALRQWVQAVEQAGGQGHVVELGRLDELISLPLPSVPADVQTTDLRLWDNGVALALVAALFLAEWAWRRFRGMA